MGRAEYGSLLTRAYDLDKPTAPADELTYYRDLVARCGEPALEVMCGSGRFLLPLLDSGVDIDGVDASEDMLDACRAKSAGSVDGRLHLQPVQTLALPREYAVVFCGGGSFGLIVDDNDVGAALAAFRDVLLPGGTLSLEVETPPVRPAVRPGAWVGRSWRCPDGSLIVLRHLQGPTDDRVEHALGIYELYRDGALVETELNEWVRRFWTADDIADAVAAAGFADVRVTRAFSETEPSGDDEMLTVRARRPRR
ncbi:MAG TPA: class I SAM-dependent methyltransferase [Acidimicrobiia bacterium]|nr:class I SAM-dependent methyltransferase [Acidimicrobiia bacterium]